MAPCLGAACVKCRSRELPSSHNIKRKLADVTCEKYAPSESRNPRGTRCACGDLLLKVCCAVDVAMALFSYGTMVEIKVLICHINYILSA